MCGSTWTWTARTGGTMTMPTRYYSSPRMPCVEVATPDRLSHATALPAQPGWLHRLKTKLITPKHVDHCLAHRGLHHFATVRKPMLAAQASCILSMGAAAACCLRMEQQAPACDAGVWMAFRIDQEIQYCHHTIQSEIGCLEGKSHQMLSGQKRRTADAKGSCTCTCVTAMKCCQKLS